MPTVATVTTTAAIRARRTRFRRDRIGATLTRESPREGTSGLCSTETRVLAPPPRRRCSACTVLFRPCPGGQPPPGLSADGRGDGRPRRVVGFHAGTSGTRRGTLRRHD